MIDRAPPPQTAPDAPTEGRYRDDFYARFGRAPYLSATKYIDILWPLYAPRSVVDLGCGRGDWLKAFKDRGVDRLAGYDGNWNAQDKMVDQAIAFSAVDLSHPLESPDRFELAMSMEVAEHIAASSAATFVESLTRLSDVVLFGAAYIKQGGAHHINEQQHTYWADRFLAHGYLPFDLFRATVWGDADISFWYQQNTFLYIRKGTAVFDRFLQLGKTPMDNVRFMNCVHPELYQQQLDRIREPLTARSIALRAIPEPLLPLAKKIKRAFS